MASLYEIDAAIMALVDPDTGEIADWDAFESLQMEREKKIENVACWYKNLVAEANMLKNEEATLRARREAAERSAERRLAYLRDALCGQSFSTARCAVSFRKSPPSVQLDDEAIALEWAAQNDRHDCIKYTAPTINKAELKKLIQSGIEVPGVQLVQGISMSIK